MKRLLTWFILYAFLLVINAQASTQADIYKNKSVEYAVSNKPNEALEYLQKALALEPDNIDYMRDQGDLAHWLGKSKLAIESYEKVLMVKNDKSLLIKLARNKSWLGRLDDAAIDFEAYIQLYAQDKAAYISYAVNEIWRGNYPHAQSLLETYENKFGNDEELQKAKADLYTRVEWPESARNLLIPLLDKNPESYELHYLKTLGEHYNHQPVEALESYQKVQKMRPDSKDTTDLKKFITKDIRSYVSGDGFYYTDSDDIDFMVFGLTARHFIDPETSLWIRYSREKLMAKETSPYVSIDGATHSESNHIGIGISKTVSPMFSYDLEVGQAEVKEYNDDMLYVKANAKIDINDQQTLKLFAYRDYYPISPLSLSLGIKETKFGAEHTYTPDFEYTIVSWLAYSDFSDGNNKWETIFAPRKAVLRSEKYKVDIGVRAWLFGFDEKLNNGYYDPELYQSYMGTLFFTYKISQENEFTLMGSAGILKDDTMDSFKFGYSIDSVLTVGIYSDWFLEVKAGYTNNSRSFGPDYKGSYVGATLKYHY